MSIDSSFGIKVDETLQHRWRREAVAWQNPSWLKLLVVVPWALLVIYSLYQWQLDRRIAARQQTTYGAVVAHEPANHNRFGFAFVLNGRTYHGWEYPQNREYRIGEQVVVYYDPANPARSALTQFDELSLRAFGPVPLAMLGIGAVTFFIYRRRKGFAGSSRQPSG